MKLLAKVVALLMVVSFANAAEIYTEEEDGAATPELQIMINANVLETFKVSIENDLMDDATQTLGVVNLVDLNPVASRANTDCRHEDPAIALDMVDADNDCSYDPVLDALDFQLDFRISVEVGGGGDIDLVADISSAATAPALSFSSAALSDENDDPIVAQLTGLVHEDARVLRWKGSVPFSGPNSGSDYEELIDINVTANF